MRSRLLAAMNGEPSADLLRTRYYDWCSAKIAEQFLKLSAEEVWRRADRLREIPSGAGSSEGGSAPVPLQGNFEVVRELAQQLAEEIGLPPFDSWAEEYRSNPDRYEREILAYGAPGPAPESSPPPTPR